MAAGADEVQVDVVGIVEEDIAVRDQQQRIPMLVLRDRASREVQIPVGSCEGFAIQIALERHHVPRPLTHDLALHLVEKLSARLERVVIDALSAHTAHATLHLSSAEGGMTIDARPGDGVALALRAGVPIYVTEAILSES